MIQNPKRALIISTRTATNGHSSGAALRVATVQGMLIQAGFTVHILGVDEVGEALDAQWDAIALVSYSVAGLARRARKQTPLLWLDCMDSWSLSRFSMVRHGDLLAAIKWVRDAIATAAAPRIDVISFISDRDRHAQQRWWRKRGRPFVFPLTVPSIQIQHADTVRLVFTGDGNYKPNRDALAFVRRVLAILPTEYRLEVLGNGYPADDNPRVIYRGYVADESLFTDLDIHLAPAFSGAGIKTKVALPASMGLLVVTNREGASGLRALPNLRIAETPQAFADEVLEAARLLAACRAPAIAPGSIYVVDESAALLELLLAAGSNP